MATLDQVLKDSAASKKAWLKRQKNPQGEVFSPQDSAPAPKYTVAYGYGKHATTMDFRVDDGDSGLDSVRVFRGPKNRPLVHATDKDNKPFALTGKQTMDIAMAYENSGGDNKIVAQAIANAFKKKVRTETPTSKGETMELAKIFKTSEAAKKAWLSRKKNSAIEAHKLRKDMEKMARSDAAKHGLAKRHGLTYEGRNAQGDDVYKDKEGNYQNLPGHDKKGNKISPKPTPGTPESHKKNVAETKKLIGRMDAKLLENAKEMFGANHPKVKALEAKLKAKKDDVSKLGSLAATLGVV